MIQQSHSWSCVQRIIIRKDRFTPVFIAALFTVAKTWKHPKCPLTDKWTKKIWYVCVCVCMCVCVCVYVCVWVCMCVCVCVYIYNSAIKKSNIDGPRNYHTK